MIQYSIRYYSFNFNLILFIIFTVKLHMLHYSGDDHDSIVNQINIPQTHKHTYTHTMLR